MKITHHRELQKTVRQAKQCIPSVKLYWTDEDKMGETFSTKGIIIIIIIITWRYSPT
jgi:hypothetical protein